MVDRANVGDTHVPTNLDRPQMSEQEAEAYRLRVVNRLTEVRIAERMGISQQRVSQILAAAKAKMPPIDLSAIRAEAVTLYEDVQRRAMELAELAGAPVTAGKDGDIVLDPESGAAVRDYQGRVMALKLALAAAKELRELVGADAAQKVESMSTVKYVIEDVSTENLR